MSEAVAKIEPDAPVAVQPETSALISMIERAARDPSVDIDKMERLFQMHERVEAKQRESAFNTAMAAAQAELRPVVRTLNNTQTSSKYADLAAISEAADPIIHAHGLGVITSEFTSALAQHVGVRIKVTHVAGYSESYDFNIPLDGTGLKGNPNKTATHAYASTITYGRRYAKCAVFDIATKNDTDGNSSAAGKTNVEPATLDEIFKLIDDTHSERPWFLAHYSVETFDDLNGKQRNEIKSNLLTKLAHIRKTKGAAR